MTSIYFIPTSESGLQNRIFQGKEKGDFWRRFKEECEKENIGLHTIDTAKRFENDDILFIQNYRIEYNPFIRNFRTRTLLQMESPVENPWIYRNFEKVRGLFTKVFTLSTLGIYFNYFDYREDGFLSPHFERKDRKFLCMINSNTMPHTLKNELYGERIKAITYFNDKGLVLYGYGWDKMPRHPFHFWCNIKCWRGSCEDKIKTLSQYTFAICFENCKFDGYVSEKIYDCFKAGTIPIYLGAPDIEKYVPKNCFIDFRDFSGYDGLTNFLTNRTEKDLKRYQDNIKCFIKTSPRKTLNSLIDEIIQ